jgi:hypothetical protein
MISVNTIAAIMTGIGGSESDKRKYDDCSDLFYAPVDLKPAI